MFGYCHDMLSVCLIATKRLNLGLRLFMKSSVLTYSTIRLTTKFKVGPPNRGAQTSRAGLTSMPVMPWRGAPGSGGPARIFYI